MQPHEVKLAELQKALARLREALALEKTDIVRDSVIQRFEFTVELSWKVLQKFLLASGFSDPMTPKNAIRAAARIQVISDPEMWIYFIDQRNIASHTYQEDLAEEVYQTSKKIPVFVDELISTIEKYGK